MSMRPPMHPRSRGQAKRSEDRFLSKQPPVHHRGGWTPQSGGPGVERPPSAEERRSRTSWAGGA
eukprot:8937270-Alexandrium_andersonii.AAC.1